MQTRSAMDSMRSPPPLSVRRREEPCTHRRGYGSRIEASYTLEKRSLGLWSTINNTKHALRDSASNDSCTKRGISSQVILMALAVSRRESQLPRTRGGSRLTRHPRTVKQIREQHSCSRVSYFLPLRRVLREPFLALVLFFRSLISCFNFKNLILKRKEKNW